MQKLVAAMLLSVSGICSAGIVGVADMQNGASVVLQDEKGPCIGKARLASFVAPSGDAVPGCWISRGHHIVLVFFDGDVGAVPVAALKPPKSA